MSNKSGPLQPLCVTYLMPRLHHPSVTGPKNLRKLTTPTGLLLDCSYGVCRIPRTSSSEQSREVGLASGLPTVGRSRAKHKRSSNGCTNCLARRKKCDEELPTCGECRRLGLVCSRRRTAAATSSDFEQSLGASVSPPPYLEIREILEEAASPFGTEYGSAPHDVSGEGLSNPHPAATREYLGWVAMMDENIVPELTRQGHLNASSAMKPGLRSQPSPTTSHQDPVLANFPSVDVGVVQQWNPTEQHLVNHFLQHLSRALVVVYDDHNPFLLELVPLAMQSLCVRHALLALSASHVCKLYPDFEDTLVNQRSLALHYLKLHLETNRRKADAFAATVLLCLFELCQGNSRKWILHLYGAQAILDSDSDPFHDGLPLAFIVEMYHSTICMARITSDKVPNLPAEIQKEQIAKCTDGIHPLFGYASPIYLTIVDINSLLTQRLAQSQSTVGESHILARSQEVEQRLLSWSPDLPLDPGPLERELAAAAESMRWASLLWLYHIMHQGAIPRQQRQNALDNIISAVSRIRPGSPAEAQLLFPLFMSGISATRKSERLRIEYRLSVLESTIGMGNITAAHKLLDEVWRRWNEGHEDLDWESLLETTCWGVVLR
ncbi:hypothetical protein GQ53DRAFT_405944 [Thozetella sp. PMI_491]|nr:hypothetical protein GQ53DRAFT_405944 [Thozetella sp. PMI_491]